MRNLSHVELTYVNGGSTAVAAGAAVIGTLGAIEGGTLTAPLAFYGLVWSLVPQGGPCKAGVMISTAILVGGIAAGGAIGGAIGASAGYAWDKITNY